MGDYLNEAFEDDQIGQDFLDAYDLKVTSVSVRNGEVNFSEKRSRGRKFLRKLVNRIEQGEFRNQTEIEGIGSPTPAENLENSTRVFLVHGHDKLMLAQVMNFMKSCELEPVVLKDQANAGITIAEKFDEHSNGGCAIIIMAPDNYLATSDQLEKEPVPKCACPNVLIE